MCKETDDPGKPKGGRKATSPKTANELPAPSVGDHGPAQSRDAEMEVATHVTPLPLGVPPDQEGKVIKMVEQDDGSASSSVDMDLSETTTTTA